VSTATSMESPRADQVCRDVSTGLKQAIGQQRYHMWFDRSARFDYQPDQQRFQVSVPNRFVAEWIGRNFEPQLRQQVGKAAGDRARLDVVVDQQRFADDNVHAPASPEAVQNRAQPDPAQRPAATPDRRRDLALRHRLNSFVLGPSNELAYAAARAFADAESSSSTGAPANATLFIHGSCGLGKTHLLQGICARVLDLNRDANVRYTTGERFTNEFLAAVSSNKLADFRKKIRQLDLLAVDDVHFLANKEKTQQEFLHSFDAIDLSGARVVLASDAHPKLLKSFSDALVSRCVRGMVAEVHPPDAVTRARIVKALAERRGIPIMEAVVNVLATRCVGSVREIEGAITKLHAMANLTQQLDADVNQSRRPEPITQPIGHALVHQLFREDAARKPQRIISGEQIVQAVTDRLNVSRQELTGRGRARAVVLARALCVALCRDLTGMSYPEIATAIGRPNHSTVITAMRRIQKQMDNHEPANLLHERNPITIDELFEQLRREITRA